MDKLKVKARTARNRVAESASRGDGRGSLSEPHSALPPNDNASTAAVNEGYLGTAARDFAVPREPPVHEPVVEPPTSLQSSVDAGTAVPTPRNNNANASRTQAAHSAGRIGRSRSNSAPQRRPVAGMRQSSIGIRRMPSAGELQQTYATQDASTNALSQVPSRLPALEEGVQLQPVNTASTASSESDGPRAPPNRLSKSISAVSAKFGFGKSKKGKDQAQDKDMELEGAQGQTPDSYGDRQWTNYSSNMVDVLDTLDPEVQTLTSLTNIQNSLFIPNLGRFVNRRPTYVMSRAPSERQSLEDINRTLAPVQDAQQGSGAPTLQRTQTEGTMATLATIDSNLSDSRYAVLPHGTTLEGWSQEDKKELNDHVRHMLHSKRSRFKRSMRGFGQYVKRPLGFLVTLYATLITLFGLAWVLFLIGWINVGGRQIYVVHIIDSVLVALFAVVGDGLAPFRAIDTYHMIFIAHFHHYTWQRRKKDMLPDLRDHNDLPANNAPMAGRNAADPEDPEKQWEVTVLTPKQQAKLEHHQTKFCKSHSFYKPHETDTHNAFPLRLLVAIVVLLDCHSLLQISLGAVTWGWYYKIRPFAVTTVILCCSITCNALAGLLITIGDHRTRKKDVLERMNRQELTEEAMQHIEKKKEKESESEREDNEESRKGRKSLNLRRHRQSEDKPRDKHLNRGEATQSAYP
ncbi:hypothetical protein PMIN01_10648 [Paraphaeosphaeria minitans]|uniref:Integral membrane protein n=1 Tax=Paraphaeosphaeria minitans TaxID=565426 RepID=A0A9P6G9H7_9PLEO|nr:hypothetical protein PMIN01_10648 [Paraphaeosphaeria minitans]